MMAKNTEVEEDNKEGLEQKREERMATRKPYMQNRELSWLEFNKRVLDQGSDPSVPLLERLQFVSIFSSNLQEFFMVRVGSLTDLSLLKKDIIDTKSNMTPSEQLEAIHERCHELVPLQEEIYLDVSEQLAANGVRRWLYEELDEEQKKFVDDWLRMNVMPFLQPQIINARHPFPHLESGNIYIIVRLVDAPTKKKSEMTEEERKLEKEERKRLKNLGAEGVTLGIIPLPKQANRLILLPGEGFNCLLLEDALESAVAEVFSMYTVKHTNIICVTRNADLDATEGADEREEDYREHMKKILKKRGRLAPVRLESRRKLSATVSEFLLTRLNLLPHQVYTTCVPMDLGFVFALPGMVDEETRAALTSKPFAPSWPAEVKHNQRMIDQVQERELLLSYPYESMDPFVQLLREAAADPDVISIKITLYRLASQSHLAEALIAAADAGKDVTALFELRARFDESNNIRWSQRFEEAGCNVIYGFHDYKVHSKICAIVRRTPEGAQYITQLGTGNYNEKTARLYTDFSFITTNPDIGYDAMVFFQNMGMESASRAYQTIRVAPLQIKQEVCERIDKQIDLAQQGMPCGLFFKTNSITDKDIIEKLREASQAGVPTTLLVRGISCLVPGVEGYTDNIRVVSIVGRLLEHSRIYGFGPHDNMQLFLSSADLMTRNMDKRVEIAWPLLGQDIRAKAMHYIDTCLADTAKLRELKSDGTFTDLGALATPEDREAGIFFNAQQTLIEEAKVASDAALEEELAEKSAFDKLSMRASADRRAAARERAAIADLEEIFREALQHNMPAADDEALKPFIKAAAKTFAEVAVEEALIPEETLAEDAATEVATEQELAADEAAVLEVEAEVGVAEAASEDAIAETEAEQNAEAEAEQAEEQEAEAETEAAEEPQPEPVAEEAPVEPAKPQAAEEAPSAPKPKPVVKAAAQQEAKHASSKPKKRGFLWRLFHLGK
ncbi:MAG: polyphosphate kinase 1 [Eggerthellaceae bacterium]|nr:polyphosphate kinase 1 [Eggerthellaceae bacterium]